MKKGTTKELYIKLLRFLDENGRSSSGEIKKYMSLSEDKIDQLFNHLSGRNNNWLIKFVEAPHTKKHEHLYEITPKGIDYLDKSEIRNLSIEQAKFSKIIAFTGIIAGIISLTYLLVFMITSVPTLYFYGDLNQEYNYCLPKLDNMGYLFKIGFLNTGKTVSPMEFYIRGENIQMKEGSSYHSDEIFPKQSFTFRTLVLPSQVNSGFSKTFIIKILNTSINEAKINMGYTLKNRFSIFERHRKISECEYSLEKKESPKKKEWVLIQ